jgi:Tfp pilus assembly protein PilO
MKAMRSPNTAVLVGILAVVVLGIGFWVLLLNPQRDEAAKLGRKVARAESSLDGHRAEIAEGEDARSDFSADYRRLVVLGKAVPGNDETASLLVQINRTATKTGVEFTDLKLNGSGGEAPAPTGESSGAPTSATEAAASLMPLGASIGPAGLAVMPYALTFEGSWFDIANFIKGLDSLVKTTNGRVAVDGRLITIAGFSLEADPVRGFPHLKASFSVVTYLSPPEAGPIAGASPASPSGATGQPASATIGGSR